MFSVDWVADVSNEIESDATKSYSQDANELILD